MRYQMMISQIFEAESSEEAQEFVKDQVENGMQANCQIELIQEASPEEIEAKTQVSFKSLLNNLNSKDMTKN